MIRFLRGEYLYYESGAIVIETRAGIGFRVFVSDTSSLLTAREGDEITAYTYMQVKEDGMALYGFADTEGLALFEQLITVKGVGPKAGLAIMSLGTPNQIKGVIAIQRRPLRHRDHSRAQGQSIRASFRGRRAGRHRTCGCTGHRRTRRGCRGTYHSRLYEEGSRGCSRFSA